MSALSIFLLVVFIIVSILLILLVLVQNEDGDSLGGVFAGGSNSAFGSRSGNVLTKTSSVLGALFFILAFGLAILNRTPNDDKAIEEMGRQSATVDTEATDDFSKYATPDSTAEPNETNLLETGADIPETEPPVQEPVNATPDVPPVEDGAAPVDGEKKAE
jgi:preprotein translocase subunit SecG